MVCPRGQPEAGDGEGLWQVCESSCEKFSSAAHRPFATSKFFRNFFVWQAPIDTVPSARAYSARPAKTKMVFSPPALRSLAVQDKLVSKKGHINGRRCYRQIHALLRRVQTLPFGAGIFVAWQRVRFSCGTTKTSP